MGLAINEYGRTSRLAIASLVLSCSSIIMPIFSIVLYSMSILLPTFTNFLGPVCVVAGIISGHIAKNICEKNRTLAGRGLSMAAIIMGYTILGFYVFMFFFAILIASVFAGIGGFR